MLICGLNWFSVSVVLKFNKLRLKLQSLSESISVVKPGGVQEVYWKLQGAS
jgi:hypothetical protein